MHKLSKLSLILFSLILVAGLPAFAQDAPQDEAAAPMSEEMMQKWMASMTPGEHHQWLSAFAGNWKSENKSYWDPKSEPEVTTGTSTCEMVLGGRFLKVESNLPIPSMNMSMDGMGFLGYDNTRKEYTLFWIDNMGTAMYTATGQREGNVLTLLGKSDDCTTGEKNKPVKYVYEFKTANSYYFAIYDNAGTPNEVLMMEENVTRVLDTQIKPVEE
ncbi:DUF1579 domain-containing protein [bacterium]|nr:DUF1579 domain-containing protein [bacterium]MBU1636272.1 DUF1579 domain-containing protein [bacterium]MBU1919869.1 DUF1579 domain-containing protein [bacterium]